MIRFDGRYRGYSGPLLLNLRLSAPDPKRTNSVSGCCNARRRIGAYPPISAFSKTEAFAKTKVVLIFSLSASPQLAPIIQFRLRNVMEVRLSVAGSLRL